MENYPFTTTEAVYEAVEKSLITVMFKTITGFVLCCLASGHFKNVKRIERKLVRENVLCCQNEVDFK